MDFFKQAASFAQNQKPEEKSGSSNEGFDVSDMMSKAQGFLGEKKPEPAPHKVADPVEKPVEKQEVKPSEDTEEKASVPVEPVKEEASEVPKTTTTTTNSSEAPDDKASYSELYSSAQTLYSGLRGKMEGKTDVDNQKLASAAEDVVHDAQSVGLLKPDNPYSDYFKKAEGYLHNFSSSDSAPKKPSSDESA